MERRARAVVADTTQPIENNGAKMGKPYDSLSCVDCRTLLHAHAGTCVCGALFCVWPCATPACPTTNRRSSGAALLVIAQGEGGTSVPLRMLSPSRQRSTPTPVLGSGYSNCTLIARSRALLCLGMCLRALLADRSVGRTQTVRQSCHGTQFWAQALDGFDPPHAPTVSS